MPPQRVPKLLGLRRLIAEWKAYKKQLEEMKSDLYNQGRYMKGVLLYPKILTAKKHIKVLRHTFRAKRRVARILILQSFM